MERNISNEDFLVVLRESDRRLLRHFDYNDALDEAVRLTRKEGCRFYILQVIKVIETAAPPIEVRDPE